MKSLANLLAIGLVLLCTSFTLRADHLPHISTSDDQIVLTQLYLVCKSPEQVLDFSAYPSPDTQLARYVELVSEDKCARINLDQVVPFFTNGSPRKEISVSNGEGEQVKAYIVAGITPGVGAVFTLVGEDFLVYLKHQQKVLYDKDHTKGDLI